MGAGSGSHAILNNGYFFRVPDGSIVMVSYFANRGQHDDFDHMDYYGQVDVTAEGETTLGKMKYTTKVDFFRAWFKVNTKRTINYGSLELTWTAPELRTDKNELENVPAGREVDTFITISRHDAPIAASQGLQGTIIGEIYGLFGTNNKTAPKADGMWVLDEVPSPDGDPCKRTPLTLKLSYDGLDLNGVDPNQLEVIRWKDNGGGWCKVAELPDSRAEPNRIKVKVLQLTTWYALGTGFAPCPVNDNCTSASAPK
ncbi:MAG TPA: hypothetical protein PKE45_02755 [Caldilineaceae bacterium]|nr:hypothetical protein [Caldilineaceae bacterium]